MSYAESKIYGEVTDYGIVETDVAVTESAIAEVLQERTDVLLQEDFYSGINETEETESFYEPVNESIETIVDGGQMCRRMKLLT